MNEQTVDALCKEGRMASMTLVQNDTTLIVDRGTYQVGKYVPSPALGGLLWELVYLGTDESKAVAMFRQAAHPGRKE